MSQTVQASRLQASKLVLLNCCHLQAISDFAKTRTLKQQRQFLPVYDCRDELLQVIKENQVVVVVGETGSGKTTQVRQLLPWLSTSTPTVCASGTRHTSQSTGTFQ